MTNPAHRRPQYRHHSSGSGIPVSRPTSTAPRLAAPVEMAPTRRRQPSPLPLSQHARSLQEGAQDVQWVRRHGRRQSGHNPDVLRDAGKASQTRTAGHRGRERKKHRPAKGGRGRSRDASCVIAGAAYTHRTHGHDMPWIEAPARCGSNAARTPSLWRLALPQMGCDAARSSHNERLPRLSANPYPYPLWPPLPSFRLETAPHPEKTTATKAIKCFHTGDTAARAQGERLDARRSSADPYVSGATRPALESPVHRRGLQLRWMPQQRRASSSLAGAHTSSSPLCFRTGAKCCPRVISFPLDRRRLGADEAYSASRVASPPLRADTTRHDWTLHSTQSLVSLASSPALPRSLVSHQKENFVPALLSSRPHTQNRNQNENEEKLQKNPSKKANENETETAIENPRRLLARKSDLTSAWVRPVHHLRVREGVSVQLEVRRHVVVVSGLSDAEHAIPQSQREKTRNTLALHRGAVPWIRHESESRGNTQERTSNLAFPPSPHGRRSVWIAARAVVVRAEEFDDPDGCPRIKYGGKILVEKSEAEEGRRGAWTQNTTHVIIIAAKLLVPTRPSLALRFAHQGCHGLQVPLSSARKVFRVLFVRSSMDVFPPCYPCACTSTVVVLFLQTTNRTRVLETRWLPKRRKEALDSELEGLSIGFWNLKNIESANKFGGKSEKEERKDGLVAVLESDGTDK
ncbi:hypothetical protein K438DRAFT_1937658 [Mycena galopus ATCC 62051]|nr:hypothetical protein K438DRAFT_1937658 [Mycena galopus ATCC 62051]